MDNEEKYDLPKSGFFGMTDEEIAKVVPRVYLEQSASKLKKAIKVHYEIEGARMRKYRTLMGLKSYKVAELLDTNQPNYCSMEKGRIDPAWRLEAVRKLFLEWRIVEIERLKKRIEYLKSI